MKRITVSITLGDDTWNSTDQLRKVKAKMVQAAVDRSIELGMSVASVEAKVAQNVRKSK